MRHVSSQKPNEREGDCVLIGSEDDTQLPAELSRQFNLAELGHFLVVELHLRPV
jgi:hypothetical protein